MITSKFVELFRFFVKNDLYPNQLFEDTKPLARADYSFLLEPSTLDWMKTRGLVFRPGINEFSIYSECAPLNSTDNKVRYALNDNKLVLGISLGKPSSLWPAKTPNEVFFLSNLSNDSGALPGNLHLTISPDHITNADVLEACSGAFHYLWSGQVSLGNTYLMTSGSEKKTLPSEVIKQHSNTLIKFNLDALPASKYDLFINGNFKKSFFALGAFRMAPLLGVMEISLSSTAPENYRLINENGVISRREYLATVSH